MEKEHHPESLPTVTIKADYPPSEYCSSEPPPAYQKPKSSAVQVAKITAVTVVLVSFILGCFLLASAYVQANASCRQLEQDLELLSEVADRFETPGQAPLQPEALVQDEPKAQKLQSDPLRAEESRKTAKEIDNNSIDNSDESDSSSDSDDDSKENPIHFKLPLQLDFDDLAGALVAKNQKSKMNCIVEKKKAEEVVDHQPKTVRLPFGVNLTTDPRYERLTGERMVIICESGNMVSAQPQPTEKPKEEEDDDEDSEHDTIMIQPVMIPIPQTVFQTHMPQQVQPMVHQQQMRPLHPMETMRPPMPPMREPVEVMRPPMEIMRHQMEPMRPPMDHMRPMMNQGRPMMQPMRPQIEQISARFVPVRHYEQMEPESQSAEQDRAQIAIPFRLPLEQQERDSDEQQRPSMMVAPQQVHIQVQPQQQNEMPPNPIIHHIIQQIIAQKIMETQKAHENNQIDDTKSNEYEPQQVQMTREMPENVVAQRIPIPEEVLTQLNRLPNNDRVIVAVSENESSEEDSSSSDDSSSSPETQEVHLVQQPRESASEMNGRQTYARRLPVSIPVPMMQQQAQMHDQEQEPQAVASEETRPHYVQPRSVSIEEAPKSRVTRSANPLVPEKRVKRCSCDCSC